MDIADRAVGQFLDDVASREVTPSGGAVAAVCGAAGGALSEMACLHTLQYGDDSGDGPGGDGPNLAELREDLRERRGRLLELADEDVAAVESLRSTLEDSESDSPDPPVRAAVERATDVPVETAEVCLAVLEATERTVEACNPNVCADAATGAFLANAGLRASVGTVRANLPLFADSAAAAEREARADELAAAAGEAMAGVESTLDVRQ